MVRKGYDPKEMGVRSHESMSVLTQHQIFPVQLVRAGAHSQDLPVPGSQEHKKDLLSGDCIQSYSLHVTRTFT